MTKITGWQNTDATNLVDCPKCGQSAGNSCRMPSGRKANEPHVERLNELRAKRPDAVAASRRPMIKQPFFKIYKEGQ